VRRLCELCGAKLYAQDSACRQCGTPIGAAGAPAIEGADEGSYADLLPSSAADANAPAEPRPAAIDRGTARAGAGDEPVRAFADSEAGRTPTDPGIDDGIVTDTDGIAPPSIEGPAVEVDDDAEPPRRGLAIAAVLAMLVVGGGGAAWWMWPGRSDPAAAIDPESAEADVGAPADPDPDGDSSAIAGCSELEALAGQWELTTEVVTSTNPAQLGIHGFFTLAVEVEGCDATAELTKNGYTGRWYDEHRIQRGKATLRPGPHYGFMGEFDLRDENGRGGTQEVVLTVHEHRLAGTYRMPGRTGFLEGARDPGRRILPVLGEQPCIARCAVACDLLRRDPEDASARGALDRCNTTCAASNEPMCGDARPLPQAFILATSGPADGLGAACSARGRSGCRTEVKIRKRSAPSLSSGRSDDRWQAAQFVLAGGAVHLGLRTPAGWFVAGPLLDLGGTELTRARLVARDLGSDRNDRYLVGEVEASARVATFACRLEGDAPRCTAIPADGAAVSPLPGRTLAIAGSTDAIEAGVYTW
jgi:hypothetical protein